MSDENTAHQKAISSDLVVDPAWTPLGATPITWEQQIFYALGSHEEHFDKADLASFESRHGPCTMESLLRLAHRYLDTYEDMQDQLHRGRFKEGETEDEFFERMGAYGVDLIFVIRVLGVGQEHPYADRAQKVLWPLLRQMEEPLERGECAISLGHLRDGEVLPLLYALLTGLHPFSEEDFGHIPQVTRLNQAGVSGYISPEIPHLLWRWAPKQAVPALLRALDMMVQCERLAAHHRDYPAGPDYWVYENHLVYALGRLEAFDALAGIEPSDVFRKYAPHDASLSPVPRPEMVVDVERQRVRALIWRAHICVAAVGYQYARLGRLEHFSQAPELQRDVEHLLDERFGLSQEERNDALAAYESGWLSQITEAHYREWLWENAGATQ